MSVPLPFSSLVWPGDPQEDENGTVQSHDILVREAAQARAYLRFRNGRDLIDHQPADGAKAVGLVGLDCQPEQRGIGGIGREGAYRDRICHVETVVLKDDNRTRLPGVILAAGNGPDFAALHRSPQSETASMNSW